MKGYFTPLRLRQALLAGLTLLVAVPAAAQDPTTLRWAEGWGTSVMLDPARGSDYVATVYALNVYDSLVFPAPDGGVKAHAAESWTVSADQLTYTFTLRDDVRFHNGDLMTAEDVVYSMTRVKALEQGNAGLFDCVNTITAEDSQTVKIILKAYPESFGPFLKVLPKLYIVNKAQVEANTVQPGNYGANGDYGTAWLEINSAGSGPYKLIDYSALEYVLTQRNADWWGGWQEGAFEYFKLVSATSGDETVAKMAAKELDVSDQWQTQVTYNELAGLDGVTVAYLGELVNINIMLNIQKAPTDDVHVRRALAYLLSYDDALDLFLGTSRAQGPVPVKTPGFSTPSTVYTTDKTKAEAELLQSKYTAAELQDPNNEIDIWYSLWVPDELTLGNALADAAAEIGLTVNIVGKTWDEMVAAIGTSSAATPHGSIIFYGGNYAEPGAMLERYHSKNNQQWLQAEWIASNTQVTINGNSVVLDDAIEEALATLNDADRHTKYAQLQDGLIGFAPTIWVADSSQIRAYQDYVYYPAAEATKKGDPTNPTLAYHAWVHDMKYVPPETPDEDKDEGCGCSAEGRSGSGLSLFAMLGLAVLGVTSYRRRVS